MRYYYQMNKDKVDRDLPNQWVCCGGVNEATKEFFLNHFSKFDTRFDSMGFGEPQNFKVIITDKFYGNVAGRKELKTIIKNNEAILICESIPFNEESAIIEKYNFL